LHLPLEASKGALNRFALLNFHFSHKQSHPFRVARIPYIPVENGPERFSSLKNRFEPCLETICRSSERVVPQCGEDASSDKYARLARVTADSRRKAPSGQTK
jgi:hypothetical protein